MVKVGWGNSLWQLIAGSDAMTLTILFILLGMSILCWAIFIYKLVLLKIKKKHMRSALKHVKNCETFDDLKNRVGAFSHTLPGYFLVKNLSFLKTVLESLGELPSLSEQEFGLIDHKVEQTIDDIVAKEESYLPFLASTAAVAPLLGLFGTVWGLIYAFIRISERGSADIVSIAPGIAAALITTLVGLVVAIPALVMYHYLSSQIQELERKLVKIADRFRFLVQMVFVNKV